MSSYLQDWILDSIAEYLKSPAWKNPIIDFIDEHCIVFEDGDENKLEYTTIHMVTSHIVTSLELQEASGRKAEIIDE